MAVGGACFLVGSLTCILLGDLLSSTIPFASFFMIYFLQVLIGLVLLDVLFNKGKNIVNMIITGALIGLAYFAFTIVSFPIMVFMTYSNSTLGAIIGDLFNTIILISMAAIAGGIFTFMMLDKKKLWRNVLLCFLVSLPSGLLLPFIVNQNPNTISQVFIIVYGVVIGLGIGLINGLHMKQQADQRSHKEV